MFQTRPYTLDLDYYKWLTFDDLYFVSLMVVYIIHTIYII